MNRKDVFKSATKVTPRKVKAFPGHYEKKLHEKNEILMRPMGLSNLSNEFFF